MSRPIGRLPFAAQRLLQTHPLGDEKQAESGKFNSQLSTSKRVKSLRNPKKQKTVVQKIKKIAMLLLVATTLVTFGACGEKEEGDVQPSDDSAQLTNTHWSYSDEENDVSVYVDFEEWKRVHVNKTYMYDGMLTQDLYDGTYTYSAGNGTMTLYNDFSSFSTFETTFKISGSTLTLNLKGETFSLTQE